MTRTTRSALHSVPLGNRCSNTYPVARDRVLRAMVFVRDLVIISLIHRSIYVNIPAHYRILQPCVRERRRV